VSRFFQRLSIRHKLVAMIMTTSAVVLLLASLGYVVGEYYRSRSEIETELAAQADLILKNSTAALQFNDAETARETLNTLSANPHIRTACLYDEDRRMFAEFRSRPDARVCPSDPGPDGYEYTPDRLQFVTGTDLQGRRVASIYLRSDLQVLTARLQLQAVIVTVLLLITLGVALLMSARMQAVVSEPVVALAKTAAEVSLHGDYSLRARRTTSDELGVLVDGFNRMLDRIQLREAELSKANEGLRREIAERRRAEQERAELLVREREANRLKDEFLATLSHELRTPLNAILGWTKLLRANAVPPVAVDRALEKIERNAQVQTRLVEDLLEVSRITSGKLRLEMRPIDLVSLVNTATESIRPTAESRGVAIERQLDAPAMPTTGDPDRLQQVIWNLLSNAVKFTPSGGIVTVGLRRHGDTDELWVADTGMGIDAAFLPSVFDTFRQADASSTRTQGGLGLGLSIVRHLVEMHGGQVTADSPGVGRGATFTVRLPVRSIERVRDPRDDLPAEPSRIITESRLAGARILVVDDDTDTRELLISVLEAAGARVYAAASAAEALTKGVAARPEALVSDIAMPEQDGYTLLRELDAALGTESPRVRVALTAYAGDADRERTFAAGYQRHITKPFDPAMLVRVLEDLLAKGSTPIAR
jgi:signal transduction histidine kinase/ActR/RegA family two-component response regulator